MNNAKIKEILESIQGEGLYIGTKQLFIRFCACNLRCNYCDTDFMPSNINNKDSFFNFTPDELIDYIKNHYSINSNSYISLTGGEPLIWNDFLLEFMNKLQAKYYLETNATITENLDRILPYISIISADIKLPSCSGIQDSFTLHDKFFNSVKHYKVNCAITRQYNCDDINIFAKIVFDNKITQEEIINCINLARKYDLELILQPKMIADKLSITKEFILDTFKTFNEQYNKIRLIPQVHKFLDVE